MKLEMNRIYCMDARQFLDLIPKESVDFCLTDPPYNINYRNAKMHFDNMPEPEYESMLSDVFRKVYATLKPNAFLVCDMLRYKLFKVCRILEDAGFTFLDFLAEFAPNATSECKFGIDRLTLRLVMKKGELKVKHRKSNVCVNPRNASRGLLVDGKSPYLFSYWIEIFTDPGDIVLDPFLGTGTTAIACKLLGRNFYACDLNPQQVEIATKRLNSISELQKSNMKIAARHIEESMKGLENF